MLKHYCGWQFRKWWPLLLIFAITTTLFFVFAVLGATLTYAYNPNSTTNYIPNRSVSLFSVFIPALISTFVMPLFVFSYRTKRQSVDTYYQAAYAPTTIKRARILIGLAIVLASFTIAYLIGVGIYGLRYATTPESVLREGGSGNYIVRYPVNFLVYLPYFFVCVLALSAQYFINCFLVNLGDYTLDQVFLLLFGTLFLGGFVIAPTLYLYTNIQNYNDAFGQFFRYGLSFMQPSLLTGEIFQNLLGGVAVDFTALLNDIVANSLFVLFGGALAYFNMRMPDPSGENADVRGARNNVIGLIPHGAALTIGFFVGIMGFLSGITGSITDSILLTLPLFIYSIFCVVYYVLLALWRHSFKISKFDLICYLSVVGFTLLLVFIAATVSFSRGFGYN